tara:strand:- start:481 stop:672 length:192 start_codon:yes stop_codon:yes gene_type:complete
MAAYNKTKLFTFTPGGFLVITKTKFWKQIVSELKDIERSKKITKTVMKIIKDQNQDEVKNTKS